MFDRQCLSWYLIHEELYWWYLNFTDAGSYPDSVARTDDFHRFIESWREATNKWNKGRKRSRNMEVLVSPLPHYPTTTIVEFHRSHCVRKTLGQIYTRNTDPPRIRRFTEQRSNALMRSAHEGHPIACPWPPHGRRFQNNSRRMAGPNTPDERFHEHDLWYPGNPQQSLTGYCIRPWNGYAISNPAYRGDVLVMYIKSPTFEQIMLREDPKPRYLEVFLTADEALVPPLAKSESNYFRDHMAVMRHRNPYAPSPATDAMMQAPIDFIRTALKMWVHDGEPVERIEQILEAYKQKTGRLYIDGATPGTQYEPLTDHETRAALAVEARCLHGAEQFAMFIPRTINTGPSDWTKPFEHDLCIQWDSTNPFTLREIQENGGV
jgi:hypothetical protein